MRAWAAGVFAAAAAIEGEELTKNLCQVRQVRDPT